MYRRLVSSSILLLAAGFAVAGCSDGGEGAAEDSDPPIDTDTGSDSDSDTSVQGWTIEKVEERDVGLQTRLAVGPNGSPAVVYWANEPYEDGICDEINVNPPPRLRQELSFATRAAPGQSWTVTAVDAPVVVG